MFEPPIPPHWSDPHGFLKPRSEWNDSGNGMFYTAFYMALLDAVFGSGEVYADWIHQQAAKLEKEPGVLERVPGGGYGQDSHDNYLGAGILELVGGFQCQTKRIIEHGVANYFVFNNDGVFKLEDFLGRFPHIFALIHETAYPTFSPLMRTTLEKAAIFMPLNKDDTSGAHLSWMFHFGCYKLGIDLPTMKKFTQSLPATTRIYFGEGCPIIGLADQLVIKGFHENCKRRTWA